MKPDLHSGLASRRKFAAVGRILSVTSLTPLRTRPGPIFSTTCTSRQDVSLRTNTFRWLENGSQICFTKDHVYKYSNELPTYSARHFNIPESFRLVLVGIRYRRFQISGSIINGRVNHLWSASTKEVMYNWHVFWLASEKGVFFFFSFISIKLKGHTLHQLLWGRPLLAEGSHSLSWPLVLSPRLHVWTHLYHHFL